MCLHSNRTLSFWLRHVYDYSMMKDKIKYLFLQYYHNRSSRKELEDFFHIINSAKYDQEISELVKMVYDEIKQTEPSLTYIDDQGNLVLKEPDWIHEQQANANIKPIRKRYPYLIAASVLILLGISVIWLLKPGNSNTLTNAALVKQFTERSEHKEITLDDSTVIQLNASSTISFPEKFAKDKREVWLSGEAFFDVKHADKWPFIIHTGKVTTTVLGTAFNIKAYPGQQNIVVSVKRGKVSVLKENELVATLIYGQEVKVSENAATAKKVEKTLPVTDVGNWQQGYLSYDDEPLQEVINDLQRVYNVDISLKRTDLKNTVITTSFTRDIGPKKALEILSNLTDTKLHTDNNNGFTLN
jgi:transmembrane sensor